jgi:hypothetical protein
MWAMSDLLRDLARFRAECQLRAILAAMQAPRLDVAFSQPFTLGDRAKADEPGRQLADLVNRRAPAKEEG